MRFPIRGAAKDRRAAERFAAACRHPDVPNAETDDLVATARLLEPVPVLGEAQRAAMRSRMLRAADRANSQGRDGAGSHDGEFANPETYSATVALPEGHAVLADVNHISSERAVRIVQEVLDDQAARNRHQ